MYPLIKKTKTFVLHHRNTDADKFTILHSNGISFQQAKAAFVLEWMDEHDRIQSVDLTFS